MVKVIDGEEADRFGPSPFFLARLLPRFIVFTLGDTKMTKAVYEAPSIVEVGTFEALTQGTQTGDFTDAVFPVTTPRGELTFS